MQDKYRERGLVVILVYAQNAEKDKAPSMAFFRGAKSNFTVYGGGQVKGASFQGIPHFFVFDAAGAMAYEGGSDGVEGKVEELMKTAPDWLAGPKAWTKVKTEADKVKKRKGLGQAAKDLRKKEESEDAEEKAEAGELLDRLAAFAEREMKRAETLADSGEPQKAVDLWKRLAKDFQGDEIGAKADAAEKEKGKDPAFKKELEAGKTMAKIDGVLGSLKMPRPDEDLDKWRAKNAGPIGQVAALYKALEKSHGDTKVFARAKALVNSLPLQ